MGAVPMATETKRPLVRWGQWKQRAQTGAEVEQLVRNYPHAGVAIVLPDGLVDLETDGPDGEQALRALRLPLPPTASFASPRGVHRLYRAPEPLLSRIGLRPHLDVLGPGHLLIAPTSTDRRWLVPGGLAEVAPLPGSWHELLTREDQVPLGRLTGAALLAVERSGTVEGQRNVTLAKLVGRWLTQGLSEDRIIGEAVAWSRKCSPPLEHDEALTVVESVLRSRRRSRSPEREALLLARAHGLRHPEWSVFIALVALWGELGREEPELFAPHRLVAKYAGVSFDGVQRGLARLERAGLIARSSERDPRGRPTTVILFPPGIATALGASLGSIPAPPPAPAAPDFTAQETSKSM